MMVKAFAPAKINLTLDVTGRREDGYHLLCTVMQTVDWYDVVTVSSADDGAVTLNCDGGIPADASNTAYKAAVLFRQAAGCADRGFTVTVEKHIPSQAGLAGGSADAAGVLHALNELTGAGLSVVELCDIGAHIGADVPFCVRGGTVLCTGTGTELAPLPALPDCTVVIVKPDGGVSTPEAYRLLDTAPVLLHPDTHGLCAALQQGGLAGVAACVSNSFEQPLALPHTAGICSRLRAGGALAAALSGSGSAVFGLFENAQTAAACADALAATYAQIRVCHPCPGVKLEKTV